MTNEEQMSAQETDLYAEDVALNAEMQALVEKEEETITKPILPFRQLTDIGNAQSLVDRFGSGLRYAEDTKKWHIWHGTHWDSHCGTKAVNMMAEKTLLGIKDRLDLSTDEPETIKRALTQARKMEYNGRVVGMLERLKYQEKIGTHSSTFDRREHLFSVKNGTLNLNTGVLGPHKPTDMISQLAPVTYDPEAKSELLEGWLDWVTQGDKEYQAFLARAVGYSMFGHNREEVLFFIYGPAATGKSTFMMAINRMFGNHATIADFKSFLKSHNPADNQRSDIAQMAGKRLVCSLEVKEGATLAADIVKTMVGGDAIKGRFLYGESFSFDPQFALWLVANDAPKVREEDESMWRRIIRLPFSAKMPASGMNPLIKHDLNNMEMTGSAWLNWALGGLKDYLENGLSKPKVVRASTEEYRREMNPLRGFVKECISLVPSGKTPVNVVRPAYERWCKDEGIGEKYRLSQKRFNSQIEKLGAERKRVTYSGAQLWCWVGLKLS